MSVQSSRRRGVATARRSCQAVVSPVLGGATYGGLAAVLSAAVLPVGEIESGF